MTAQVRQGLDMLQMNVQQLELLVEADVRLVPGTVRILEEEKGKYLVTAKTVEFGSVEVTL